VALGGSQAFTANPASGYELAGWTVDGSAATATSTLADGTIVTVSGPTLTFSSVQGSHTVGATFSGITRIVQAQNASGAPGASVVVPVTIVASGVENGVSGTLTFDPTVLTYSSATLGSGATGATYNVNTDDTGSGSVGFVLALPVKPATTFASGTQQILNVTFTIASGTVATNTPIGWSSQPALEQVVDVNANVLPAIFTGGTVTMVTGYEGDVLNHGAVDLADWVKVGRFAVGLDTPPTSGLQYQEADCAPRGTCGSGNPVDLADWVQTGRYAVGLDPLTPVGGPTSCGG
jgi:hypothetical protein